LKSAPPRRRVRTGWPVARADKSSQPKDSEAMAPPFLDRSHESRLTMRSPGQPLAVSLPDCSPLLHLNTTFVACGRKAAGSPCAGTLPPSPSDLTTVQQTRSPSHLSSAGISGAIPGCGTTRQSRGTISPARVPRHHLETSSPRALERRAAAEQLQPRTCRPRPLPRSTGAILHPPPRRTASNLLRTSAVLPPPSRAALSPNLLQ
jgi:hypothetical protein